MSRVLFFVLCLNLSWPVWADKGGHDVGNGGDSLVISIRKKAREILEKWKRLRPECSQELKMSADEFGRLLKSAKISTTPDLLKVIEDGRPVFKEVVNYPETTRIIFHRDSYRAADEKDQLVIHEFLGLARIADDQYEESRRIADAISTHECFVNEDLEVPTLPESAKPEVTQGFMPTSVAVDSRGILYLLDSNNLKLHRFDLNTSQYKSPLALRFPSEKVVYSEALNRLYLSTRDSRITYIDLDLGTAEHGFVNVAGGVGDLIAVHKHLLVIPNQGGSWLHYYVYDLNARITSDKDWSYPGRSYSHVRGGTSIYYISNFSPNDLHKIDIVNGKIVSVKDSPYHGDYRLEGPIVVSANLVALGSGLVFNAQNLSFAGSLPHRFDGGIWNNGQLITATVRGGGFDLKFWDDRFFEKRIVYLAGAFVSLVEFKDKPVVVYVDPNSRIKVRTITLPKTPAIQP